MIEVNVREISENINLFMNKGWKSKEVQTEVMWLSI